MDAERLCANATRAVVATVPLIDPSGRDVLVVLARLSYAVSPAGVVTLAPMQSGLRVEDVAEESSKSLRYVNDLFDYKPGTDVLMVGTAHPPADERTNGMDVSLQVAGGGSMLSKTVRVHGPRVFLAGARGTVPGPAAQLAPTPLRYELAYGGVDREDERPPRVEWRNPVGTGVARRRSLLVGRAAPQLEDPAHPLSSRHPAPAAFGPIAAWWKPRSDYQGTYDERWARERAPVRPLDFDARHYSVAPPDLWSEEALAADVWIEALGVRPEGPWRFQLPRYSPAFTSVIGNQAEEHATHLDTYQIDADSGTVELSWRAAIPMPRKAERLELVHVGERDEETILPVLEATARAQGGKRRLPVV